MSHLVECVNCGELARESGHYNAIKRKFACRAKEGTTKENFPSPFVAMSDLALREAHEEVWSTFGDSPRVRPLLRKIEEARDSLGKASRAPRLIQCIRDLCRYRALLITNGGRETVEMRILLNHAILALFELHSACDIDAEIPKSKVGLVADEMLLWLGKNSAKHDRESFIDAFSAESHFFEGRLVEEAYEILKGKNLIADLPTFGVCRVE